MSRWVGYHLAGGGEPGCRTGLVYGWVGVLYNEVAPMALGDGLAEAPWFEPVSRNGAADATGG